MSDQKHKFIIIDGSSLMYRAFYALPPLMTTTGLYTNAITGFANMLGKILQDYEPQSLVVAFDKSRQTFRTEMFAQYKGTRNKTPDELKSQFPILKEFVTALNIPFLEMDNYEADDIIGTLATKAAEEQVESLVVTGDKDALQLVNDFTKVLFTKKGINDTVLYDVNTFQEQYEGLMPLKLIDLKALMGDKSDNIPGVAGVGEKTALKLIKEYGSLDNLLANISSVKGAKLQEKLNNAKEDALMSYKLATICTEAPVEYKPEDYKLTLSLSKLEDFCSKYELRSVLNRWKKIIPAEHKVETGLELLNLGMENTVPDYKLYHGGNREEILQAKADTLALYPVLKGSMPFLQVESLYFQYGTVLGYVEDLDVLQPLLEDENITKIIYDVKSFYHAKGILKGKILDVMLLGYLIDPAQRKYDLETLSQLAELSIDIPEDNLNLIFCQNLKEIGQALEKRLDSENISSLYWDLELPLAKLLYEMENNGIYLNQGKLDALNGQITGEIAQLEEKIHHLAGCAFKISSPKQLGDILFNKLGLPALKKTKTGYSTNAEVLEMLMDQHPIIGEIANYRILTKLKSTYLDGLKKLINPITKRIHTTFNQTVTETGRLSSSEPNLQNIPVRTAEGRKIRDLFEPGEGYDELLSADYSQIELRVMAHMSQDPHFLEAFNNNEDIHAATAAQVFKVAKEDVTSQLRSRAKAVNFGIIYGISGFGLAKNIGSSPKEADDYIKAYLAECKGVKEFMDSTVQEAKAKGYVATMLGRKRYLPAINSANFNQRQLTERMAMNTPIQGTAADIIKIAMNKVGEKLAEGKYKSRILLQVHDELVLEIVKEEKEAMIALLKDTMEHAFQMAVPLVVDCHWGKTWAEAK